MNGMTGPSGICLNTRYRRLEPAKSSGALKFWYDARVARGLQAHGGQQRAGRAAVADLDVGQLRAGRGDRDERREAARTGEPQRDLLVHVGEVHEPVERDPVARIEAVAGLAATRVGLAGGGRRRALLVLRVLDLLAADLHHVLVGRRQRGLPVGALVGVGGADAAGDVAAVRRVLGVRLQRARAAGLGLLGVPVRVVHEHERHGDARAVDRAVLGIGGGDGERDRVAPLEEVTVERRVDRDRRRRVADGDRQRLGVRLAGRVGDGQLGRVDAVGRVDVRRVRIGRVDRAVAVEVPREADRVTRVGVARAVAGELHVERRDAVGRRGVHRRPAARAGP